MFRYMPFILLAVIGICVSIESVMPFMVKQGLYALSLTIQSVISMLLPFIIFGLLFKATVKLSGNATRIIGITFLLVCGSNFLTTFLCQGLGIWAYGLDLTLLKLPQTGAGITGLWTLTLPKLIANDHAMFGGILTGIIVAKKWPHQGILLSQNIECALNRVLRGIVYIIPLFVAGFVVKLQNDGVMGTILKDYGMIFSIIALAQFSYITLAYFLLHRGNLGTFCPHIRSMLPASISGFSTMSSAASLPLLIIGAEQHARSKEIIHAVIPATINIHLVGDCIAIPVLAYAILKSFGMPEPSLLQYTVFTLYFILAKFSVAAIPGGGIIVMTPILDAHLGFTAEMLSLITALYILFDPVITSANVFGNGAFAKLADRVFSDGKSQHTAA